MLGIVGESGSGKTTLLNCLAGRLTPEAGSITYDSAAYGPVDVHGLSEARRRLLSRTEWGFVNQDARDGLRMGVSAGANIGERLMAVGARHYGDIRRSAADWLDRVEIEHDRLDDRPTTYSGGMRQRLQIARNLVSEPRLVFMDEPTGGLDVSVQARILDLLRGLVGTLQSVGGAGDARSRRRPAADPPADGDAGRPRGGGRPDRPGAGRSAARLHPDARRFDPAGMTMQPALRVSGLTKSFVVHAQGDLALPVLRDVALAVSPGECLALVGPSGAGKSTLLRSLYGNYRPDAGSIRVRHGDDWVELVRRRAAHRARRAPPHPGLRQPVPARDPARRHRRRRGRAGDPPRR